MCTVCACYVTYAIIKTVVDFFLRYGFAAQHDVYEQNSFRFHYYSYRR